MLATVCAIGLIAGFIAWLSLAEGSANVATDAAGMGDASMADAEPVASAGAAKFPALIVVSTAVVSKEAPIAASTPTETPTAVVATATPVRAGLRRAGRGPDGDRDAWQLHGGCNGDERPGSVDANGDRGDTNRHHCCHCRATDQHADPAAFTDAAPDGDAARAHPDTAPDRDADASHAESQLVTGRSVRGLH